MDDAEVVSESETTELSAVVGQDGDDIEASFSPASDE